MSYILKFASSVIGLMAILSASVSHAVTPAAPHAGVYKNVTSIEENGDLLGMAVEFKPGPSPVIVATTCEGQCYGGRPWPVTIKEQSISFTVCDKVLDQNKRPAPCNPLPCTGVFRNANTLELVITGQPDSRIVLKRDPHPLPHAVEFMACLADHC